MRAVLRGIAAAAIAITMAVVGSGTADASIALGRVVSTNPVNYTPNVNQGAVYKMAEVNGTLYAGGGFSTVTAAAGTTPAAPLVGAVTTRPPAAFSSLTAIA